MDAVATPAAPSIPLHEREKRSEFLLDALKTAVATGGEVRLFRAGKLNGLFPARTGSAGEAATTAIRDGLLSLVRTESKGKQVVEWVHVTPTGVTYLHDHDSPKAVLRELKQTLDAARGGLPEWMDAARQEVATLSERFERRAAEMLARLDSLANRVEETLRRAEAAGPTVSQALAEVVPWALAALAYLDSRKAAGATEPCPFPELYRAVRAESLAEFHDGLRRLYEAGAVRLEPAELSEPEFAAVIGGRLCGTISR
jgi:hypothetical protein